MANRRMFSRELTESDKFLEMPASTQALFFHLGMNADDEGYTSSPKKIMRMCGCREDDLSVLIAKGYIIPFDSGVVVIVDWTKHNQIRADRFKASIHSNEKLQLESLLVTDLQPIGNQVHTSGCPSLVESSIVKVSKVKKSKDIRHKHGEYKHVLLTDAQLEKLKIDYPNWKDMIKNLDEYVQTTGKPYKDHNLVMRNWEKDNKTSGVVKRKAPDWGDLT